MSSLVHQFIKKAGPTEGAVLFGSQLADSGQSSDTDIVLFCNISGSKHHIGRYLDHFLNNAGTGFFAKAFIRRSRFIPCGDKTIIKKEK